MKKFKITLALREHPEFNCYLNKSYTLASALSLVQIRLDGQAGVFHGVPESLLPAAHTGMLKWGSAEQLS